MLNEQGHRKFVESLRKLIERLKLLDPARYKPTNSDLTIPELESLYAAALAALDEVADKRGAWRTMALDKTTFIETLPTMGVDAVAAFAALSGVTAERVELAKTHLRKLQGRRKAPITPNTPDANISAAQTSQVQRIGHFSQLTELLEAQNEYNSVTGKNAIANLKNAQITAQTKLDATIADEAVYANSQDNRDKLLYTNEDSIAARAARVKNYVKSEWGSNSAEFKEINKISFKKP